MEEQNFKNHSRFLISYHVLLFVLVLAALVLSIIILIGAIGRSEGVLIAVTLIIFSLITIIIGWLTRSFALKAQDRAIRAEENLRYFAITGNLLDSKLTTGQIIALRFASNNELVDLAHKAVAEKLPPKAIKKLIVNWKADHHRV